MLDFAERGDANVVDMLVKDIYGGDCELKIAYIWFNICCSVLLVFVCRVLFFMFGILCAHFIFKIVPLTVNSVGW